MQWYEAAGRPAVVVFWNRQISTEAWWRADARLVSQYESRDTDSAGKTNATSDRLEYRIERNIAPDARREMPPEDWFWKFDEGLNAQLLDHGVTVVDRAAALQIVNAGGTEIQKLRPFADWVVQILFSSQEPDRVHARAVEIASGRLLGSMTIDAALVAPSNHWEATSRGYERVAPSMETRPLQLGRDAASQLLLRLSRQSRGR